MTYGGLRNVVRSINGTPTCDSINRKAREVRPLMTNSVTISVLSHPSRWPLLNAMSNVTSAVASVRKPHQSNGMPNSRGERRMTNMAITSARTPRRQVDEKRRAPTQPFGDQSPQRDAP